MQIVNEIYSLTDPISQTVSHVHALLNFHPETRSRAFVRAFSPIRGCVINSRNRSGLGRTCTFHCSSSRGSVPWIVSRRAGNRETENHGTARHPHGSGAKKEKSAEREREKPFLPIVLSLPSSLLDLSRADSHADHAHLLPRSNDTACFCYCT